MSVREDIPEVAHTGMEVRLVTCMAIHLAVHIRAIKVESETDMHLRAAANYIQSGHFAEALNVLDGIKERRALWYFYSASANSGVGNNVTALEHAQKAVELEPNNLQYQMLLQRLQGGGGWYQQRQGMYGYPVGTGDACMRACIATALCNLCCGGGCCYVPVSPGGGYGGRFM